MARKQSFDIMRNMDMFNSENSTLSGARKEMPTELSDENNEEGKSVEKTKSDAKEVVIEETKPITKTKKTVTVEKKATGYDFSALNEKKERKTVKKTYLLLPSVAEKLDNLSKEYDVSNNELLNEILKQFFNNLG